MLCGLVYVYLDRITADRPTLTTHENGETTFRGRPCNLCFGLQKVTKSEYRMVVMK